jgi:P4 family phage/plasmid primase-like protien
MKEMFPPFPGIMPPPPLMPCKTCKSSFGDDITGVCKMCADSAGVAESPAKVEMKQSTLKMAETATPAAPVEEQMIAITSGLSSSDTKYDNVPVSKVEDYLKGRWNPVGVSRPIVKRKECYERTQPTQAEPTRLHNRVYVDLDGKLPPETSEDDFSAKVKELTEGLVQFFAPHNAAIKQSCKWKCADDQGNVENKLSFTIHYKAKAGTKKAIGHYVKTKVAPKLTEYLKDILPVKTTLKKKKGEDDTGCLVIDLSVFNEGQRKMRMLGQTKPCQDRPYTLVCGEFVDTLITYIPRGCPVLPEPQSILELAKVVETVEPPQPENESVVETETSDPSEDDLKTRELLSEVLDGLDQRRWDYYPDWIRIGFVMFNEGYPLDTFLEYSKKSKHWRNAESPLWIKQKWKMFRKSNLSQVLLWKWLSEDDLDLYMELSLQRKDFWNLVKNPSHAEVARFFYNLKPDAYLYNEKLGWFQLLPNNIWKVYEKQPNGLLADIWHTLSKMIKEHQVQIDITETDDEKAKAMMKKLTGLLQFKGKIGNKGFCDGVIAFLPSCFNDDELDKKMDEQRHLVAFSDMVYDLDAGAARPIEPEDYICLNTGYAYPTKRFPEARKELINTIRSVFEEEADITLSPEALGALTSYVLKTLAMNLHGRKKYEKFFVWTGSGGNGKGLISEIVKRVLGDYYHTVPHQVLTKGQDKKDATCPPLAKAKGKRCVMASEPEADDKLQVGAIKEWTGGDAVSARDLYRSTVSFVPQFVLFLQTNNIPQLNRPDGGIQRRLEVVHFPFVFCEAPSEAHHKKINIDLKEKIIKSVEWRNEMWFLLLEAYQLLESDGLGVPRSVIEKSREYMDEQNPIKEWLEQNFTTGLDRNDRRFFIESSKLLESYINQTKHQMDASRFKASMEMLKIPLKKEGHDFKAMRYVSEKCGDEWVSSWKEATGKAGKYWCGLKRAKAPMPPGCNIED